MNSIKLTTNVVSALLAFGLSQSLFAAEIDFALSDKSVYGKLTVTPDRSKINVAAGYLYHTDSRNVYHLDLHAQGQTVMGNLPTTAGIGFKAMGYKEGNIDGLGLGIGGFADVNIPEVPGLSATAAFHYAPSILSTSDMENFKWFEAAASYRVIQNADVQAGYRYVGVEIEGTNNNRTVESGLFLGIKLLF